VKVYAQNVHWGLEGAFTGEVSAPMLAEVGAAGAIVGHSERRQHFGETDEGVARRARAALAAGLSVIACVGETEAEREAGRETAVVGGQLAGSLPEDFAGCIAYEPVWAIGTGKTPTEQDVAAMHGFIRRALVERFGQAGTGIRILYGGSVKPDNAARLLRVPEVGGALVGGASLKAADFLAIARAAG